MTPQEQQMIDGLISRIRNTPAQGKDAEAEQHIQGSLGGYPDALYVLVQTVLVQQYGLQQAQAQRNELKQQNGVLQEKLEAAAQQARNSGGSFLSHIFGGGNSGASSASQQSPQYQQVNSPGAPVQGYPAAPPPPPPGYPAQGYPQSYPAQTYPAQGGGMLSGGGGGFLQGALQTAAGVAAGEMVFQGMEDLFHGFGHGGYERGFGGSGSGGGETIVNNYYDEDRGEGRRGDDRDLSSSGKDDNSFYNPEHDASRSEGGDAGQGANDLGTFGGDAMNFSSEDNSNDLSFDNGGTADTSSFDSGTGDDTGFDDSASGDFSSDNS